MVTQGDPARWPLFGDSEATLPLSPSCTVLAQRHAPLIAVYLFAEAAWATRWILADRVYGERLSANSLI